MRSEDVLQLEQGSLYPAAPAHQAGMDFGPGKHLGEQSPARFYGLTARGRRQLAIETSKWDKLAGAIARILMPAEQEGKS